MTEQQGLVTTMTEAVSRFDDWINDVIGMGSTRDPSVYTSYRTRAQLSDGTLEALFVEEHFAARIVELLPRYALRRGWDLTVTAEPAEAGKIRGAYQVIEEALEVATHLQEGAVWGRLFGGAITWIGADDDQDPENALDETKIKSVRWLHTFDRRDVQVNSRYADPDHPKFQQPETFRITPRVLAAVASMGGGTGGVIVHESRCIVWPGQKTTNERKLNRNGWDDSVLERSWDALKQAGEDYSGKSMLLARVSQFVFKIKNLGHLIAKDRAAFSARMDLLDRMRSRGRALVIDTEESAENITQGLGGVDVIIDKDVERVAISGDVPLTVYAGRTPAGGNAEAELDGWYANVEAYQTATMLPRHTRIAQLILLAKDGPVKGREPEQWSIRYRPLRMPKPKEVAELRKLEAEADAIEIDKGIIPPEAVALARHTPTGSGNVVLDTDEVTAALKRRRELASKPPKDNAELGTVSARAGGGVMELLTKLNTGVITRGQATATLVLLFGLTEADASTLLDTDAAIAGLEPRPAPTKPGPAPAPANGTGAGAPQGLPGVNAGGAREPGEKRVEKGSGE